MTIPIGAVLSLEYGEYSDYTKDGPFRVLREINKMEISSQFVNQRATAHDGAVDAAPRDFIAWLIVNGYIEDVGGAVNWYLGGFYFRPENAA